jgi:hypothetical protein
MKFKEKTTWMTEHGNIDDFVASWERQEHVPLMPLAPEVLHVTTLRTALVGTSMPPLKKKKEEGGTKFKCNYSGHGKSPR